jgi:hypothetical protein
MAGVFCVGEARGWEKDSNAMISPSSSRYPAFPPLRVFPSEMQSWYFAAALERKCRRLRTSLINETLPLP